MSTAIVKSSSKEAGVLPLFADRAPDLHDTFIGSELIDQTALDRCLGKKGKGASCIRAVLSTIEARKKFPDRKVITAWRNFKRCAQVEIKSLLSRQEDLTPLDISDLVFVNASKTAAILNVQFGNKHFFFLLPLADCGTKPCCLGAIRVIETASESMLREEIKKLKSVGVICDDDFHPLNIHPTINGFDLCRSRIFENEGTISMSLNNAGIKHSFGAIDTLLTKILPRVILTSHGAGWSQQKEINEGVVKCVEDLLTLAGDTKTTRGDLTAYMYTRLFYCATKNYLCSHRNVIRGLLNNHNFRDCLELFRDTLWSSRSLSEESAAIELATNALTYRFEGVLTPLDSDSQFHHEHLVPAYSAIIESVSEYPDMQNHIPSVATGELNKTESWWHSRLLASWQGKEMSCDFVHLDRELKKFLSKWPEEVHSMEEELRGKQPPEKNKVLNLMQRLHIIHEHDPTDRSDHRSFSEHVITSLALAHDPLHPGRPICARLFGGRARYFPDAPPYPPITERKRYNEPFIGSLRYVLSAGSYDEFEERWLHITHHIKDFLFSEHLNPNAFNFSIPPERAELARRVRLAITPEEIALIYNNSSHMSPFWVHRHCQSGYSEWLQFAYDRIALDFIHGLRMELIGRKGLNSEVGEFTQKLKYRVGFDIAHPLEDLTDLTDEEIVQGLHTVVHTMRHRTDKFTLNGSRLGTRPLEDWTQKDLQEFIEYKFLYRMPGLGYVRNGPFSLACYFGAGFACPCFIRWPLANTDGQRVT